MSAQFRAGSKGQKAVEPMSELAAFAAAVLLFSTGIIVCSQGFEGFTAGIDHSELYNKALEISKKIQNHEALIYKGQQAVFELNKLEELESSGLNTLITIDNSHGVSFMVTDLTTVKEDLIISLSTNRSYNDDIGTRDKVVVNTPVNLHLNGPEIHFALMTLVLWR